AGMRLRADGDLRRIALHGGDLNAHRREHRMKLTRTTDAARSTGKFAGCMRAASREVVQHLRGARVADGWHLPGNGATATSSSAGIDQVWIASRAYSAPVIPYVDAIAFWQVSTCVGPKHL